MKEVGKNIREKYSKSSLFLRLGLLLSVVLYSCEAHIFIEEEVFPGDAYIALSWTDDEPDYIDPGTNAIPNVFYWDDYYYINPGVYSLYYDGEFNNGSGFIEYAWEVEYEIYINWSDEVDYYEDIDNYFVLECNPLGPYVFMDYKSSKLNEDLKVLNESDTEIVVLKENKNYSLKATYKKVKKRSHS